jgi:arylsulfatase A-like enzyme
MCIDPLWRYLYLILSLIWASVGSKERPDLVKGKPNILFIMGDDLTTQAISCYNGIFKDYTNTINTDRLAPEGIRFQNVLCTNAICSPARATSLTGNYSHKNGFRCLWLRQDFDTTQAAIATELQKAGYQTALLGKWHLGTCPTGFDDYKVLEVQDRNDHPELQKVIKDNCYEFETKSYQGDQSSVA